MTMNDRERAIHLNPVQVVASALAAITAAVLASFFGVAGTVVGAGVVSAAASIGNAVYSYWINSTNKALRVTIPSAFRDTIPSAVKQPAATVRALVDSGARVSGRSSGGTGVDGVDPDNTNEAPVLDPSVKVGPPGRPGAPPIPPDRGRAVPPPPPPPGPGGRTGGDFGAHIEARWSSLRRLVGSLRWRNIALATVAVFVLSMTAVTVVEALAKKPLSGIVGGSTPAGATTSFGGLVSGSQAKPAPTPPSTPSSSTTTNPQTTTPNGSSTTTTSPSSSSTAPSTTTTTPSSSTNPSTPSGSNGSTPGSPGPTSGAPPGGSSSSFGGTATGATSSGGASGTQSAGG
jgi:hypothetical protein